MRGHLRFRAGAWRLTVDAGIDPTTRKRRQLHRTIKAPDTKTGRRTAETALARLVTEVEAGRVAPRAGMTVDELLERYIADRSPRWSPGAADETRARIVRHVSPRIGQVPIDRVRPIDLSQLYAQLQAGGLSGSSVARIHDILRAAFRLAVRWELIARSPADAERLDAPARDRTEVTPPAAAEVIRLLEAADDTLRLYIRLSAVTGARRGTMCALRWADIDADAGEIRFTRALAKVKGGAVEKGTKTGARYPVAVDPTTVQLLREHRRRQIETALSVGVSLDKDAYLFARDPAAAVPWHPDGASQRFGSLRKRLHLGHVTLKDLRHWMATEVLGDGDVVTLAGRGGWADATTPLRVYAHFVPARDRAAADRLGATLDGGG